MADTVRVPRQEFEAMKREIEVLRNSRIYQRLLEFEQNIAKGRKYTRKHLGF